MSRQCVFCKKFTAAQNLAPPRARQEYDTILHETRNFVVIPALGSLVEGHLLIVTKSHFYSMGELSKPLLDEFTTLRSKVRQILIQTYGSATMFEHGATREIKAGGSVNHAHYHALPLDFDLAHEVSKQIRGENVANLFILATRAAIGVPYLFIENNRGELWVFDVPVSLPSQYLRRLVAAKLGNLEDWDWQSHPALERVTSTIAKLRRAQF